MTLHIDTSKWATSTFSSIAAARTNNLARSLGLGEQLPAIGRLLEALFVPWGDRQVGEAPRWPSGIGADHSPFELSVTFGQGEPKLRLLVEAQADQPTAAAQWEAGRALTGRLAQSYGLSLERLSRIEELFAPVAPGARFGLWHAASLQRGEAPTFQIYLNPAARGRGGAAALVEEALERLGFRRAFLTLAEITGLRGHMLDEITYFSLDLTGDRSTRVKVYLRHHHATITEVERALSTARGHRPGDGVALFRALSGGAPITERLPAQTTSCLSFVDPDEARPATATLCLPPCAPDDRVVSEGARALLSQLELPVAPYEAALTAFQARPLEAGVGMQRYISLQRRKDRPRVTVYLAPELYRVEPPGRPRPADAPRPSAEEIVPRYEEYSLALHPFFTRLRREPVDLGRLWLLMANFREAIGKTFVKNLATTIARVDSVPIRCLLARQLYDELGEGDPNRAHTVLFERFFEALAPFRPATVPEAWLEHGAAARLRAERYLHEEDPMVAVGGLIQAEVYAKQMDIALGDVFRRQDAIRGPALEWLTLHETLEVEHADDSSALARLVPRSGPALEAVWRGAEGIADCIWAFYDAMYRIFYSEP
jgi:DMATS type aromatic prenyltransferase